MITKDTVIQEIKEGREFLEVNNIPLIANGFITSYDGKISGACPVSGVWLKKHNVTKFSDIPDSTHDTIQSSLLNWANNCDQLFNDFVIYYDTFVLARGDATHNSDLCELAYQHAINKLSFSYKD